MSDASLIVRILADSSSANSAVDSLITKLGAVAGVGAGAGIAAEFVKASMDVQSAMARVQTAYNSADFAPGTTAYENAKNSILKSSTELATSFDMVADVYAQGGRFIDEFGNKLSPEKVDEYTDSMIRLSKVSSDALDPTDIGRRVDVFEKLFNKDNFKAVGSALSAESGIHNQGEGPLLDTANAIGQYGAPIGVSQAQALGLSNYLVDLGVGGQTGGSSIGRTLQRMNTAADNTLDPVEQYASVKKNRDAEERLADLNDELGQAQQKRGEMFGQHGLKKQYAQHPSEVAAADQRIAKLQREISDQQQDMGHLDDAKLKRGDINLGEMAKVAGQDQGAFAQEFKDSPVQALLDWAKGANKLDPTERAAAIRNAGITNVRDIKTFTELLDRPEVAQKYIDIAQQQIDNPTDLASRSSINLGTTKSKVTDVQNAAKGEAAAAGDGPRQAIDAGAQKLLEAYHDNTESMKALNSALTGNPLLGIITTGVVSGVTAALPVVLSKVLVGGAAGAGGGAGPAGILPAGVTAGGGALATAGTVVGAGGVVAATAAPFVLADAWKTQHPDAALNMPIDDSGRAFAEHHPIGTKLPDSTSTQAVNVGGVTVNVPPTTTGWEAMKNDVINAVVSHFSAAWDAATAHQPVSGQLGGNFVSGQGPH